MASLDGDGRPCKWDTYLNPIHSAHCDISHVPPPPSKKKQVDYLLTAPVEEDSAEKHEVEIFLDQSSKLLMVRQSQWHLRKAAMVEKEATKGNPEGGDTTPADQVGANISATHMPHAPRAIC
ncbi:hypothetical protein PISMIDRAFT_10946 [Pisolithus microcarpus 441]|uniref:Unplaced genomic scaffold scaffold_43, whole genome shotgun sequence n=1 Tax=Pisolithus microcarpus 441 TaxID=765257 RepID=A0A0C9ZLP0_9AGAM|nr:hypothetical protein BKA83DRAFT_10946 [Pisolithus microcarpus]KIK17391.1 hypothetical protein PISMIDRAFT_15169 [Pisolithus microcarpus 441]KIK23297.1 hypothetical protein PISMIDRAFT_10946 [Pisolithus microcarpus 441]